MRRPPSDPREPSLLDGPLPLLVLIAIAILLGVLPVRGQTPEPRPAGREIAGLPALNFDADEGFGYGAILQLVDYGRTGARPYRALVQPTLFRTTRGRQDLSLFVDAPALLPGAWRLTVFAGVEDLRAAPYYGVGNETVREAEIERTDGAQYYRYERRQARLAADLQRRIAGLPVRALVGGGASTVRVGAHPNDAPRTLLARELGDAGIPDAATGWVRAGLVLDTRDREIGPSRGRWAEVLVQHARRELRGGQQFTRTTATWREYLPVGDRLVVAARATAQQVEGDVPFHELSTIQSSWRQSEGIGGAGSVRGLPKNRFVGRALVLYNAELRWRATSIQIADATMPLELNAFVDAGRVWSSRIRYSELAHDLHAGYGAGLRLRVRPSFVVGADVGHSRESTAPVYVGLGYAF